MHNVLGGTNGKDITTSFLPTSLQSVINNVMIKLAKNCNFDKRKSSSDTHMKYFYLLISTVNYTAEVYPNGHGQMCPMRVSRVRFSYVNTLKSNNIAENSYFSRNRRNWREISKSVLILAAEYKYKPCILFFAQFCTTHLLHLCIAFSHAT